MARLTETILRAFRHHTTQPVPYGVVELCIMRDALGWSRCPNCHSGCEMVPIIDMWPDLETCDLRCPQCTYVRITFAGMDGEALLVDVDTPSAHAVITWMDGTPRLGGPGDPGSFKESIPNDAKIIKKMIYQALQITVRHLLLVTPERPWLGLRRPADD